MTYNPEPLVRLATIDDVHGEAKKIYEQFIAAGNTVPKWIQVMANNEDIFVGFFAMFKATMDDAPLPALLKWKVAKQVSDINKCAFCVDVANSRLKQFGLDESAIDRVVEEADEREQIAIRFAEAATKQAYEIDPAVLAAAKTQFNDSELVELTAVVGLFNYINRFNDALNVLPE